MNPSLSFSVIAVHALFLVGAVACAPFVVAESSPHFEYRHTPPVHIDLAVTAMSLPEALNLLAERSGFVWHDPGLAQTPVSVTCSGDSLEPVLACLLGENVSYLIHRKTPASTEKDELWLMIARGKQPPEPAEESINSQRRRARQLAQTLEQPDPQSEYYEQTVQAGLADSSALVRAQAVYGLTRRDPPLALVLGLADADPDVRLMALENAGTSLIDQELLRKAVTDLDATVSQLATLKLNALQNDELPD